MPTERPTLPSLRPSFPQSTERWEGVIFSSRAATTPVSCSAFGTAFTSFWAFAEDLEQLEEIGMEDARHRSGGEGRGAHHRGEVKERLHLVSAHQLLNAGVVVRADDGQ